MSVPVFFFERRPVFKKMRRHAGMQIIHLISTRASVFNTCLPRANSPGDLSHSNANQQFPAGSKHWCAQKPAGGGCAGRTLYGNVPWKKFPKCSAPEPASPSKSPVYLQEKTRCKFLSANNILKQHSQWPFHTVFLGVPADNESLVVCFCLLCHSLAPRLSTNLIATLHKPRKNHLPTQHELLPGSIATHPFFFKDKCLFALVALRLAAFIWPSAAEEFVYLLDCYHR